MPWPYRCFGELGALFTQPPLQFNDQGAATLLAHAPALLRRKAVDLTLNGEQDIDALDRRPPIGALLSRARSNLAPAVRPARSFEDQTWLAIGLVELVEAGVGVGLHQPGIAGQMLLWMLSATIRRIEEHGCRWIGSGKRAVVAHIGPEPAGPGLSLGQDRHRGVVGMDAFRCKDMASDRIDQRHQGCRGGAHPVGQRRDIEVDAFAPVDLALTVERQVQAILANRTWASSLVLRVRVNGCEGAGGWLIASQARQTNFSRTCWITSTGAGRVPASRSHLRRACATGCRRSRDKPQASDRQGVPVVMLRQRPSRRLAALERWHRDLVSGVAIRCSLGLRGVLLEIGELQLELIQQGSALRGLSKLFVPQLP